MSPPGEAALAIEDNESQQVVLCVDDESSILMSLKRALRKQPFELRILEVAFAVQQIVVPAV